MIADAAGSEREPTRGRAIDHIGIRPSGTGASALSPHSPPAATDIPLLLFDGKCGVCTRSVRLLLRWDRRRGTLRFAPLGSQVARSILARHPEAREIDSLLWYRPGPDGGELLARSDAVLAAGTYLGGGWAVLAAVGRLVPRILRDALYDLVARYRLRFPGMRRTCRLPTPEESRRFLER